MRIAITGTNGFIGKHLCEYLERYDFSVTKITRDYLSDELDNIFRLDGMLDSKWQRLADALLGCDAIVHTIGVAHTDAAATLDPHEYFKNVNVDLSSALAKICKKTNIKTFVFISSVKAVAEESLKDKNGRPQKIQDHATPKPEDVYGKSKLEAENAIMEVLAGSEIDLVILRPPLVYGIGQKGNLALLTKLVSRRLPIPLKHMDNIRSLISVNNLCDAIKTVLARNTTKTGRYFVSDVEVSTAQLVEEIARGFAKPPLLITVPNTILSSLAKFLRKERQYRKIAGSLIVDDSDFRKDYDWKPRFSFREVVEEITSSQGKKN